MDTKMKLFAENRPRRRVFVLACIVIIVNLTVEFQSAITDIKRPTFAVAPRLFNASNGTSSNSLNETRVYTTKLNFSFHTLPEVIGNLTSPVTLITVNFGFVDFLHNLLFSIWRLRLQPNIVIICEDKESFLDLSSYQKTLDLTFKIVLTHQNVSTTSSLKWLSPEYGKLVTKRPRYVQMLVNKGLDVFFIDSDIVLLGDPFPFFNGTSDVYAQKEQENKTELCAGFFYMKSNDRTQKMVSRWIQYLDEHPKEMDQNQFNKLLNTKNISVTALPPDQFSSGYVFRASDTPWFKRSPPLIEVHANFIIGKDKKKEMLRDAGLWFVRY